MRKTNKRKTNKRKTKRLKQRGGSAEKFIRACEQGDLREAYYYFNKIPESVRSSYISADDFRPFRLACKNGHLDVARWLLRQKPNIDIFARNNESFINACKNGHLNVAQWLYQKSIQRHQTIDISLEDGFAFREACGNGHLDVCQWLFQTDPSIDITARYNDAFERACMNRHLNVAQWLASLKPEYSIVDENSDDWSCQVLTDPKDIEWNKKKKLVWLASQPRQPGADNMVARLPTDVARITASYL
jgi:ankyrin repeat protein